MRAPMLPLPLLLLALPLEHAAKTPELGWKAYAGKGYTCSGAEFRGEVPNENGTAAGCAAAAQAMPDCAGVNYATWRTSDPTVCYTCRIVPGAAGAAAKLGEAASMTSLVGPLPPVPPSCPKIFRRPAFVRHFNFSVVPKRCGHIDMEPLLPPELSDQDVSDYLEITLNALGLDGIEYLRPGECGKVYDNHDCLWESGTIKCEVRPSWQGDHSAVPFTKRNNPPSLPTPWVAAGNGGQVDHVFTWECLNVCKCTLHPAASGEAATRTEAPPCSDSVPVSVLPKYRQICKVCGQAFNDKLAKSLVQLWCDPTDPNCAP